MTKATDKINTTFALAQRLRAHALRMTHRAKASHIGSCFSMADILAVLYGEILQYHSHEPTWPERDRLVISKGHAAAIVYAALAECGYFSTRELDQFQMDNSRLAGHVTTTVPGVEVSTGSLGHGLPIAAGMALTAKKAKASWRTYCILSDGELDEGSNWEAIQFAQHAGLSNLIAIVDYNKIQSFGRVSEISQLEPLSNKFSSFNWRVHELDGHDHAALTQCLRDVNANHDRPCAIIAHTIKGKGVSFMEDQLDWHYRSVNDAQLVAALAEIGSLE